MAEFKTFYMWKISALFYNKKKLKISNVFWLKISTFLQQKRYWKFPMYFDLKSALFLQRKYAENCQQILTENHTNQMIEILCMPHELCNSCTHHWRASISRSSHVTIWFCPHFIFYFSLPFLVTWPYVTWSVTWLSCHMTTFYCSHFLLSCSLLSTIYGDSIVSRPIASFSIVPLVIVFVSIVPKSPIVHLIRTLSHGSCLSSI